MKLTEEQVENRAHTAVKNLVDGAKCANKADVVKVLCKLLAVASNALYVVDGKASAVDALSQLRDGTARRTDTYTMEAVPVKGAARH